MRDDDHYDRTCGPDFKQVLRKSVKEFTAEVGKASTEKLMDLLSTTDSWDAHAAPCADFAGRNVRYREEQTFRHSAGRQRAQAMCIHGGDVERS